MDTSNNTKDTSTSTSSEGDLAPQANRPPSQCFETATHVTATAAAAAETASTSTCDRDTSTSTEKVGVAAEARAEDDAESRRRQTDDARPRESSAVPAQTPSERLLIKVSVHNSNVAVRQEGQGRQQQSVEELSVEDRLPSPKTSGTTRSSRGANIDSLEKGESDTKQSIGKKISVQENGVNQYDDKVWYALGITVARRLLHLKKLTRTYGNDCNAECNAEWDHVVSGIVDTLRVTNVVEEEKQLKLVDALQDDVRELIRSRMKQQQQQQQQQQVSSSVAANETPNPSDSSFGVFGSAISTVSSLRSVVDVEKDEVYNMGGDKSADKTLDAKQRREAYATTAVTDDGGVEGKKGRTIFEDAPATHQINTATEGSDDILRILLYPDTGNFGTSTITTNRPNSPLTRDASNGTNNTASTSTPGAFRVRSMAHGPSTVQRARAGDSASPEHTGNYSYTHRTFTSEGFDKGQDICVEAVACDDDEDIEEQQVVVIAKEVTIWQQLLQPKILAVIGCLMLVVVAIAVPITMKADSKAPAEDIEMAVDEDEDRDEFQTGGAEDVPMFACNFTEHYTKVIGKGLEDYGLTISLAGDDAIRWLGERMSYLNLPSDQFAFCEKDIADQSLLQIYALASIFFSSSPSQRDTTDPTGTTFCDKDEGDIGWPSSIDSSDNICKWEGVLCADTSNTTDVVSLDLSRRGWSGGIPNEFVILKDTLSYLDLSHNRYFGSLPSTLGSLENLFYLDVSANLLTGTIPSALANLTVAYEIYLDNNAWNSPTVPPEVCNLRDTGILTILAVGEGCNCCSSCPSLSLYHPDWI